MIIFKYVRDKDMISCDECGRIVMTCDRECASDILEVFKRFLLAQGFSEKTVNEIQMVEEDDE